MKFLLQRTIINLMLILALLLLTTCGYFTYKQIYGLLKANEWVVHTYKVIHASGQTAISVLQIESQLNHFILTKDTQSIQAISNYANKAQKNITLGQALTIDNPSQLQRFDALTNLVDIKLNNVKQIITDVSNHETTKPALIQQRIQINAAIRNELIAIKHEELKLLNERNHQLNQSVNAVNLMLIIAGTLTEILFIASILLLNYHLNKRNAVKEKLIESEAYKSAILEAASDSIITIDEHNKIVSCNHQTEIIFGYRVDNILNENINFLSHNLSHEIEKTINNKVIECDGIRKNGEHFPLEVIASRMQINEQTRFVLILRDITERKKIEMMKNEFISVVSHELRTPLTSIRGSLGLIAGGAVGELPGQAKKLIEIANNNSDRLLLLINDILDLEKIGAGKMNFVRSVVDVKKLVTDTIQTNKIVADKYGVKLKLNKYIDNLKINVDPDRIVQVLTNLISNAIKFAPKGSAVNIDITEHEHIVRIAVTDTGPGISKEFQSRIFQKFSQADSSNTRGKSGTGLGLSISHAIVEQLGGILNFESIPNEHTTFYMEFPLWVKHPIDKVKNTNQQTETNNHIRLLICEDDADQAKYLTAILEAANYKVDTAYTANEARKFLANNRYHVLLLDLILPDQDGIAFIRELRRQERTLTLPIIVTSAIAQTGRALLRDDPLTVSAWLEKPVDFDVLLNSIAKLNKSLKRSKANILHIEDDIDTQLLLKALLEDKAVIQTANSLMKTQALLQQTQFDLVILDLLLPDGYGTQLLPLFLKYKIPVIVYSNFKLESIYASYVSHALLKSDTPTELLLNTVMDILETK